MKYQGLYVNLESELHQELKVFCTIHRLGMGSVVADLIRDYLRTARNEQVQSNQQDSSNPSLPNELKLMLQDKKNA